MATWKQAIACIAFSLLLCMISGEEAAQDTAQFKVGDTIDLECKIGTAGTWGSGPTCKETNQPLIFLFGIDYFLYCGLQIADQQTYDTFAQLINSNDTWYCRVPMSPERTFYVPFTIPLWGVVEADHLHVNNHMNFVFHADQGKVIGVAAYPVRDRFQFGKPGALINMHGPVHWFSKHTFDGLSGATASDTPDSSSSGGGTWFAVLLGCFCTGIIIAGAFVAVYQFRLKPNLVKKYLKKD
eukprot:CAMPEP_0184332102 /NCGR_PEP_ID=MMETSP1089-20130417/1360_1 /TAXON_ID=38269 ORGANISM="Gloeochaete wittrockiana, Strain SAG46.84" /NCGR_SAMPLE_ID=MMETSP1089 /ASSEMBLY_ACC=CAM_ASM_000445 /LENGTH=239 /DNA_ID=CAMNT_0026655345 /DNA_START=22 /DNA_END=738 /DNA_ORIENTATION=+